MHPASPLARSSALGLLLGLAFCPCGEARAQAPQPTGEEVALEVKVCLASRDEGEVDAECQSVASHLQRLPVRFPTLRHQHSETVQVVVGQSADLALPDGVQLELRPVSIMDLMLNMQVVVEQADRQAPMTTGIRLIRGHSVILGGVRNAEGNLLIEVRQSLDAAPPLRMGPTVRQPSTAPPPRRVPQVRRVGNQRSSR